MSMFMRKRKRSVQLNNRIGSRRNRILFAISLSLVSAASWLLVANSEVPMNKYLVASTNISSSIKLTEANLISVEMDLGENQSSYLEEESLELDDWVLIRPVSPGELIPLSAIAPTRSTDCSDLVVQLGIGLASAVKVGDRIDLWAADSTNSIESIPVQVVTAAELISIKQSTDSFSQGVQSVEICISAAEIRSAVSSIARKSTLVGIRSQN
jgi:hypothetical protein